MSTDMTMTTYLIGNDGTQSIHRPYNIISAIAGLQSDLNGLIDWETISAHSCSSLQNWFNNDELYDQFIGMLLSLIQDESIISSVNIIDNIYLNTTLLVRMLFGNNLDTLTTNSIVEDLYVSVAFKEAVSRFPNYNKDEFEVLCTLLKDVAHSRIKNKSISRYLKDNIKESYYLIDRLKQRDNHDELVFYYIQTLSPISKYISNSSIILTSKDEIEYVRDAVAHETISAKELKVAICSSDQQHIVNTILYYVLNRVLDVLYSPSELDIDYRTKYATLFVWSLLQKGIIKWIVPLRIFSRLKSILNTFVEEVKPST